MICNKCGNEIGNAPYCVSTECLTKMVYRVENNPTGGFLTYFEGSKYPIDSYPKQEDLNYLDTIKRVIISTLRFVLFVPITPHRIIAGIQKWMGDIYSADHVLNPNRFTRENWVASTNAMLDALILANEHESDEWCYYLAAIWDGDLAYRFRGMDMLQNLDKELLKKNPKREIMRLVNLSISRERDGLDRKTAMVRKLLKLALLSKEFKRLVVTFLTALDVDKMQYDTNEFYWLANKFDYDYAGMSFSERMAWKEREDKDFAPEKQKEPEKEKPRIAILPPNQEFYDLSPDQAQEMIVQTAKILRDDWLKHQKV